MYTNQTLNYMDLTPKQQKILQEVKNGLSFSFGDDIVIEILQANSWNKIASAKKLEEISEFYLGTNHETKNKKYYDFPKYSNDLNKSSSNQKSGAIPKNTQWKNNRTSNDVPQDTKVDFRHISSLNSVQDRVIKCIEANIKVLVLMRGCPGSGKSTLAQSLLKKFPSLHPIEHIFSSDDFFVDTITGVYNFKPELLEQAHEWNRKNVLCAVKYARTPVIVDNTHTMIWEMSEYAKLAVRFGYVLEVLEPSTPWFFEPKALKKKTLHNVPLKSIENMISRYARDITGANLLRSLKLSYKPGNMPPQFSSQPLPKSSFQTRLVNTGNNNDLASFNQGKGKGNVQKANASHGFSGILSFEDFLKANEKLCAQKNDFENDDSPLVNIDSSPSPEPSEEQQVNNLFFNSSKPNSYQDVLELAFSDIPREDNFSSDRLFNSFPSSQKNTMTTNDSPVFFNRFDNPVFKSENSNTPEALLTMNELSDRVNNLNLKSYCQEYVLVQINDQGVEQLVYQKDHAEMPLTLDEFRRMNPENQCVNPNCSPHSQGSSELPCKDSVEENYFSLRGKDNTDKCALNAPNPSSVKDATLFLGSWDDKASTSENPKNQPMDSPKPQRLMSPQRRPLFSQDASSNTNYKDFEALKSESAGIDAGAKVLFGNTWKYYHGDVKSAQSLPLLSWGSTSYGVDRSTMTSDIVTNQVKYREAGVEKLIKMFPQVPVDNLAELFDKCQKDIDWTVGLLLDSGYDIVEVPEEPVDLVETQLDDELIPDISSDSSSNHTTNDIKSKKTPKKKQRVVDLKAMLSEAQVNESQDKFESLLLSDEFPPLKNPLNPENSEAGSSRVVPNTKDVDEQVLIALEKQFVLQLQDILPTYLTSSVIDDLTLVKVPFSLVKQLQECIMNSVEEQMKEQEIQVVAALLEDEETATAAERYAMKQHSIPSFEDIMDEQLAINAKQSKTDTRKDDISSKLALKLLQERFSNMDPTTLTKIFEDTNHSLHDATMLLTFAGHSPQTNSLEEASSGSSPIPEGGDLSNREEIEKESAMLYEQRKECLEKAQAYYRLGNRGAAAYYSEMAKWYKRSFDKTQKVLTEYLLITRPSFNTLDLHYLPVLSALRVLDEFIKENIEFLKANPAINKVNVMIITGRGKNSLDGKSKIKPAIEKRLLKLNIEFEDSNPGMLKASIRRSVSSSPS